MKLDKDMLEATKAHGGEFVCIHCGLEPQDGDTHGEWRTARDAWEAVCTVSRELFVDRPAAYAVIYELGD